MKKILKKIGFGLALAGVALTAACGGGTAALDPEDLNFVQRGENGLELIRTAENLTFYSSDGAFAEFLNDFYSRHIRSGKKFDRNRQDGRVLVLCQRVGGVGAVLV